MSEYEREARRERLSAFREEGRDPYPARVGPHRPVAEIREIWEAASKKGRRSGEAADREQ